MKIAHVVATIDEPTAGPSLSVASLCRGLSAHDAQIDLHTVSGWRGAAPTLQVPGLLRHPQDFARWPLLGSMCLSSRLEAGLRADAARLDVIHTHGLWLMPNVYPSRVARSAGTPVVISPRGMLGDAALKFSRLKKQAFWSLFQARAVARSACLHATGEAEHDEIRAFGIDRPVAVIPNGVDIPDEARPVRGAQRTALSLGRIHPKKGLANLVRAWADVEARFPDWRLRIVGPDELGHAAELAALAAQLGLTRVSIEGPAVGAAKQAAFQDADLFVLPTLNENFALTVAEALAAGAPVIATRGAPWSGLEREGCGWWIDIGPAPLALTLADAMAAPDAVRGAMGARGRAWMARDFSWSHVAAEMMAVYQWIVGAGDKPASVRLA